MVEAYRPLVDFDVNKSPEELRRRRGIKPIALGEVQRRGKEQLAKIRLSEKGYKSFSRGVEEYLRDKSEYAILPEYKDLSAEKRIKELKKDSRILDVSCGIGRFPKEVVSKGPNGEEPINSEIKAWGCDALKRTNLEIDNRYFVQVNLLDLSPERFGGDRYEMVTNVATSYHVPNYYGHGIAAMTRMLKPGGILEASSLSRAAKLDIYGIASSGRKRVVQNIVEDGEVVKSSEDLVQDNSNFHLIRSQDEWTLTGFAGVFRPDGSLVTPKDYFSFLQAESDGGFIFEYSIGNTTRFEAMLIDGKLVVEKLREDAKLNLSKVFYAKLDTGEFGVDNKYYSRLAYIIAETQGEEKELRDSGFVSLVDIEKKESLIDDDFTDGKISKRIIYSGKEEEQYKGKDNIENTN